VSLEVRRECNPSNLDQAGIFIERLLDKPKHESGFLLGVIQKGIKADISYDIDHCYPWSEAWTRPPGMTEEKYNYYVNRMNSLVNLQLLDYSENRSKQATPFDVWFNSLPPQRQEQIRADHLIPEGHPVAAKDFGSVHEAFDRFYDTRRKLLKARLLDILDEHE
jgi:hypothetical protein